MGAAGNRLTSPESFPGLIPFTVSQPGSPSAPATRRPGGPEAGGPGRGPGIRGCPCATVARQLPVSVVPDRRKSDTPRSGNRGLGAGNRGAGLGAGSYAAASGLLLALLSSSSPSFALEIDDPPPQPRRRRPPSLRPRRPREPSQARWPRLLPVPPHRLRSRDVGRLRTCRPFWHEGRPALAPLAEALATAFPPVATLGAEICAAFTDARTVAPALTLGASTEPPL